MRSRVPRPRSGIEQPVIGARVKAVFTVDGLRFKEIALARTRQAIVDNAPDAPGYPAADTLFPFGHGLSYTPVSSPPGKR